MPITRQIANTSSVKMMRDLSSGILKQFAKVLTMLLNIFRYALAGWGFAAFSAFALVFTTFFGLVITSHFPPRPSILVLADALKACARTVSFFLSSPMP